MAVLNLRNVPDETMVALRVAAAERGMGLHNYCVQLLRGSAQSPAPIAPVGAPEGLRESEYMGIQIT